MGEPSILEIETSPETAAYRDSQRKVWAALAASRGRYVADALRHGATPAKAEVAADGHVRGEVRAFLTELLVGAPGPAAAEFVQTAPAGWADKTELLLKHEDVVLALIGRAYPSAQWAGKIHTLSQQMAAENATWTGWVRNAVTTFVPPAEVGRWMDAALGVAKDVGRGFGDAGSGLGRALGMLPLALGLFGLGAVAIAYGRNSSQREDRRDDDGRA